MFTVEAVFVVTLKTLVGYTSYVNVANHSMHSCHVVRRDMELNLLKVGGVVQKGEQHQVGG